MLVEANKIKWATWKSKHILNEGFVFILTRSKSWNEPEPTVTI